MRSLYVNERFTVSLYRKGSSDHSAAQHYPGLILTAVPLNRPWDHKMVTALLIPTRQSPKTEGGISSSKSLSGENLSQVPLAGLSSVATARDRLPEPCPVGFLTWGARLCEDRPPWAPAARGGRALERTRRAGQDGCWINNQYSSQPGRAKHIHYVLH